MAKELEKKLKEAKSEEELLTILDAADPNERSDKEVELLCGGFDCPHPEKGP